MIAFVALDKTPDRPLVELPPSTIAPGGRSAPHRTPEQLRELLPSIGDEHG